MQAKSDSAMSISEGKAKGVPMTPTAQIAAIRQKRWLDRDGDDVNTLLALWDTHQSALRGLVAQWRAAAADELNDYAVGYDCCADHLERLLESEQ